jgi:hypothetical protein
MGGSPAPPRRGRAQGGGQGPGGGQPSLGVCNDVQEPLRSGERALARGARSNWLMGQLGRREMEGGSGPTAPVRLLWPLCAPNLPNHLYSGRYGCTRLQRAGDGGPRLGTRGPHMALTHGLMGAARQLTAHTAHTLLAAPRFIQSLIIIGHAVVGAQVLLLVNNGRVPSRGPPASRGPPSPARWRRVHP